MCGRAGLLLLVSSFVATAGSLVPPSYAPHPGLAYLLDKAYVPADFDQRLFDRVWEIWEEPLRTQAASATPAERRRMAFDRYGFNEVPGRELPLQYTPDGKGGWSINCLSCHAGTVGGQLIPGLPNTHLALQTLTDDIRAIKIKTGKRLGHMDVGSMMMPLGRSNGTTNAVIFGVALGSFRDNDLNIHHEYPLQKMVHHDHDAPPWWNVKKKKYLYSDGFAPKSHRALMQFLLVDANGPEKFREWESEYAEILNWIESLEAPKYPYPVESALAAKGEKAFRRECASCHGSYGPDGKYPNKNIPLEEIGTDPVRHAALPVHMRAGYARNWLNHYGQKEKAIVDPPGYVAPPLDGIWASAPYFHNGAVPTLWHVLNPEERPAVWLRSRDGYDCKKVGLEVETMDAVPTSVRRPSDKRKYFDTHIVGKSPQGHLFPNRLTREEKFAVLEYLKTL